MKSQLDSNTAIRGTLLPIWLLTITSAIILYFAFPGIDMARYNRFALDVGVITAAAFVAAWIDLSARPYQENQNQRDRGLSIVQTAFVISVATLPATLGFIAQIATDGATKVATQMPESLFFAVQRCEGIGAEAIILLSNNPVLSLFIIITATIVPFALILLVNYTRLDGKGRVEDIKFCAPIPLIYTILFVAGTIFAIYSTIFHPWEWRKECTDVTATNLLAGVFLASVSIVALTSLINNAAKKVSTILSQSSTSREKAASRDYLIVLALMAPFIVFGVIVTIDYRVTLIVTVSLLAVVASVMGCSYIPKTDGSKSLDAGNGNQVTKSGVDARGGAAGRRAGWWHACMQFLNWVGAHVHPGWIGVLFLTVTTVALFALRDIWRILSQTSIVNRQEQILILRENLHLVQDLMFGFGVLEWLNVTVSFVVASVVISRVRVFHQIWVSMKDAWLLFFAGKRTD